ncbi:MAG: extracellular matrix regulator RemB [Syntrophomonadaceae bacterium]|jgi:regulator of extracellular matrix RemA (YlzA/DUF370 family)
MYIHLGNNHIISSEDIIVIINLQPPWSEDILDIIQIAKDEKKLINISESGKEKSLVVCDNKVYKSPISSTTLSRRSFNT